MRILTLTCLLVLLLSSRLSGFEDDEDNPTLEEARNEVQENWRPVLEKWRTHFLDCMAMHIQEIELDCDLRKSQMDRLKLAARGAVDHHMKRWMETIARRLAAGNNPHQGELVEAVFDEDDDTRSQLQAMIGRYALLRILVREPVWERALKTTLPEAQRKMITDRMRRREESWQMMTIRRAMEAVDRDLLLADRQKAELRPVLELRLKKCDPLFVNLYGGYVLNAWIYGTKTEAIDEILTRRQLETWEARKALFGDEFGDEDIAEYSFQNWFETDYEIATGQVQDFVTR